MSLVPSVQNKANHSHIINLKLEKLCGSTMHMYPPAFHSRSSSDPSLPALSELANRIRERADLPSSSRISYLGVVYLVLLT